MATILGLVWSMSILGFLYSDTLGIPPFVQPVRSRMFLYKCVSLDIYFKSVVKNLKYDE